MTEHKASEARGWLDLIIKSLAVIAVVAYMARRDAEIVAATSAVVELRAISGDLAKGLAVNQVRIEALADRLDRMD